MHFKFSLWKEDALEETFKKFYFNITAVYHLLPF